MMLNHKLNILRSRPYLPSPPPLQFLALLSAPMSPCPTGDAFQAEGKDAEPGESWPEKTVWCSG